MKKKKKLQIPCIEPHRILTRKLESLRSWKEHEEQQLTSDFSGLDRIINDEISVTEAQISSFLWGYWEQLANCLNQWRLSDLYSSSDFLHANFDETCLRILTRKISDEYGVHVDDIVSRRGIDGISRITIPDLFLLSRDDIPNTGEFILELFTAYQSVNLPHFAVSLLFICEASPSKISICWDTNDSLWRLLDGNDLELGEFEDPYECLLFCFHEHEEYLGEE